MTDTHHETGVRGARGGRARPVQHVAPVSPQILARSRALQAPVVELFNEHRAAHGLAPLAADAKLAEVAAEHSADMLRRGYFAHNDEHGSWDARIRRSVQRHEVGEILAFGSGDFATPAGLVKSWMASPEHRTIILTPDLRRVGLGVATGTYEGENGVSLTTADFSSAA
jgi:uncharacterized protein YkwD